MKKSLVAAVLTIGLIGNTSASCDSTPYNAPEELQPDCAKESPVLQNVDTSPVDKLKENREIDLKSERNTDSTERHVLEKSSQSKGR